MYDNDQAAWKATDIVLERTSKVSREKIRGWITEPGEHGIRVVFVGEQDGHAVGLYESTPSQADFVVDSPARTLDADELAQFTARQTAKAAQSGGCSDRYNAVVLPDGTGSDRKWRAYLIPATEDPDAIPIGGYFRYYISADGKTVLSQRAFTKSCLMSSRKLSQRRPSGRGPDHPHARPAADRSARVRESDLQDAHLGQHQGQPLGLVRRRLHDQGIRRGEDIGEMIRHAYPRIRRGRTGSQDSVRRATSQQQPRDCNEPTDRRPQRP